MALQHQWKCQDNAASTVVAAFVGTNAVLEGGDNTSVISVVNGPGSNFPRSLDLDGTADAFDISAASISFAAGAAFSFAAWLYFDALGSARGITGTTATNLHRILLTSTTNIGVAFSVATLKNFAVPTVSLSTWYHLLVTKSADDAVRVFWNGTESVTGPQTIAETFAPVRVGRSFSNRHAGPICDVRVYNSDESANVAAIIAEAGGAIAAKRMHLSRMMGM